MTYLRHLPPHLKHLSTRLMLPPNASTGATCPRLMLNWTLKSKALARHKLMLFLKHYRQINSAAAIVTALFFCAAAPINAFDLTLHDTPAAVYFSPNGGAQSSLVQRIELANDSILVLAYSFTSVPLAQALINAHRRGVAVQVILDKSQRKARRTVRQTLLSAGITVYIDTRHAIAHNKVMVIDGRTVVTGSFNFTKAAETKNAENLNIFDSPVLAHLYQNEWVKHRNHAQLLNAAASPTTIEKLTQ